MSYGVYTLQIHKKLRLDKRKGSDCWYARLTLDDGKRMVKSTKTADLDEAKERALKIYYETKARIENNLPAQTRKFKHVAAYAIKHMRDELDQGGGRQAYKDYISALNRWLIPYFGTTDIAKVDFRALKEFDAWRTKENGKQFSQSGINNHNAALNRVLDEAELRGWITKSMRPTLLNKGVKSESRGSFTKDEYTRIYTALRKWHEATTNAKAAATREVLRNYVLFLANTGVRHGTEALGLRWRNIDWHEKDGQRYLIVNVDGKTRKRAAVARDTVERYLERQGNLNPRLAAQSLGELVSARCDEFVFTTRLGAVATIHNLNAAFNALLDDLDLKTGADGKTRTLYSLRHYYATQDLKRGVTTHALSKQLGNSTAMIDKYYSKYSPLINAEVHAHRPVDRLAQKAASEEGKSRAELAFGLLAAGEVDEEAVLAVLGVGKASYHVTGDIALLSAKARADGLISEQTLLRILNN